MIRVRHDADLLQLLKNAGYNSGKIRRERIFGQDTLSRMRHKGRLTMGELEALCRLLGGQPGDYIEYVPDVCGDEAKAEAEAVGPQYVDMLINVLWSYNKISAWEYLRKNREYAALLEDEYMEIIRARSEKRRHDAVTRLEAKIISRMEAMGGPVTGCTGKAEDMSREDGGTV